MNTIVQYIFYLAILIVLAIPLGKYIGKVMSGEKVFLSRILVPCEKGIYRKQRDNRSDGGIFS